MQIQEIPYRSNKYQQVVELRNQLLRLPLGLDLLSEDLSVESKYIHFATVVSDQVVACVQAVPASEDRVKLRQMAVAVDYQGQGVGRQLLEAVECLLRQRGVKVLELDARKEVIGFYEKLGYTCIGEEFVSVTIPHQRMSKTIEDSTL